MQFILIIIIKEKLKSNSFCKKIRQENNLKNIYKLF